MGSISFVILNYKIWQESVACAESILQTQTYGNYSIVIVGNGSGNDSAERLRAHFAQEKRVSVVASEENLGFARGNNLGIAYARDQFDPDFIVVANSDIIFEQPDYCEELVNIYKRKRYDILGGDIVDAGRMKHLNPVARERSYSLSYMRKQVLVSWAKSVIFRLIRLLHLKKAVAGHYGLTADENGIYTADGSKNLTTREVAGRSVAADERMEHQLPGVLLHGCCLIFSRDFFKGQQGFYDKTFLYAEEEILYYLALKKNQTVLYSPKIVCVHKEGVSTKALKKDFFDAKIFYFSHITHSYRIFLELMKEYE